MHSLSRPIEVLYAEDNEDDLELMRACLVRSHANARLHHVENGAECLRFLRRQRPYENAPRPDLLLLDINMPEVSGPEVMEAILADPNLRSLPVITLTTSAAPEDIDRMYQLRCSAYVCKPLEFDEFARTMRIVLDYWLTAVTLPTHHDGVPAEAIAPTLRVDEEHTEHWHLS